MYLTDVSIVLWSSLSAYNPKIHQTRSIKVLILSGYSTSSWEASGLVGFMTTRRWLTFSPVRCVPVIRLLVFVPGAFSSLAFWPLVKFRPSRVDLFAARSLRPNEEPGHPEEPHSDPHLQPPRPEALLQHHVNLHHLSGLLLSRFTMEPVLGRVNHMWCLSCCDKAICKSTLLFFSPSPSSLGVFEPPNKGEVLFWVETIIRKQVWDLMLSD